MEDEKMAEKATQALLGATDDGSRPVYRGVVEATRHAIRETLQRPGSGALAKNEDGIICDPEYALEMLSECHPGCTVVGKAAIRALRNALTREQERVRILETEVDSMSKRGEDAKDKRLRNQRERLRQLESAEAENERLRELLGNATGKELRR